jgi:long-chain acyl-CoA synthetase
VQPATHCAPRPIVRLLPQLADLAARQYGDAPFILRWTSSGWEPWSFREAARRLHAFTALLEREGVVPGDRVAIQSENRPEWGLAYLAIVEAGAVAVPLDALLKEHEVGEILAQSGARFCIVSDRQRPVVERARQARVPELKLLSLDASGDLPSWPQAQELFPDESPRPERAQPDDLAVLLFTSGTTGQAKAVMLSHSNLLHNVEGIARFIPYGMADRMLSVLPLHHTFEFTIGFLAPLRGGASVAYARGLKSNELREDLRTAEATILVGVPLLYEKLLGAIRRGVNDAPLASRVLVRVLLTVVWLASRLTGLRLGDRLLRPLRERAGIGRMRMFVSGAAALPSGVFWGFTNLGITMVEGYGLTECSPVVAANRFDETKPGNVGHPLPGVEIRVDDPDSEGNGEVMVRGPNVMLGYYNHPQATAEALRDGWFFTGDLGRVLSDGRLRITGRVKNMIATAAGKKIYPEEVEIHLSNSPYILEVVVAGGRDARGDREEVHAHVFPDFKALGDLARSHGLAFDEAFVDRALRREVETRCHMLAPYKRVKRIIVRRQEFPKTTTGKIRRQDLSAGTGDNRKTASAVA